MMTAEDCLRAAFQSLLNGDLKGRDRYVALARNVMAVGERLEAGYPAVEAVVPDVPISRCPTKPN